RRPCSAAACAYAPAMAARPAPHTPFPYTTLFRSPESNIGRSLFEGLVAEAPNGDLIPGVAESWEISEDGKTYTFHLRANARWSNGDPVTAGDFVYGMRRSVDPKTLSVYSFILAPIENANAIIAGELPPERLGVTAIDDRTLEIRLENPTPY